MRQTEKTRPPKMRELKALLRQFLGKVAPTDAKASSSEEFSHLLAEFQNIHAVWEKNQILTAEDFNMLRTMRLTSKELCHSDILAWLLDHRLDRFGTHAQRNCGFRLFLRRLDLPAEFAEADYRVAREVSGEESRLDILIEAAHQFVIGIENKILSKEMADVDNAKDQTLREWDDLKRRGKELHVSTLSIKAFFLTPDEQQPRSSQFTAISWRLVADVFEEFAKEAKPPMVKLFAQHYAETLRRDVVLETKIEEEENEED